MNRSSRFAPSARTLTVTSGRETLGTIKQKGERQFLALHLIGETLGVFATAADAAQAINKASQVVSENPQAAFDQADIARGTR